MTTGTAGLIATHSDLYPVYVMGLGETPRPRPGKAAPTGEVIYTTGCILRVERKDGSVANDKSASVSVINQAAIYEAGAVYRAQGRIWIRPWSPDGSMSRTQLAIVVEQLVPAETTQAPTNGRETAKASA